MAANSRVFMFLLRRLALFLARAAIHRSGDLRCIAAHRDRRLALDRQDGLAFPSISSASPPFLLHLAYIPGGRIRRFNDWGDYSYGVYIYAFPVQQTLAFLFPKLTVIAMSLSAGVISLGLAFCSWNLVEKRAMGLKDVCANATAGAFERGLDKARSLLGWPLPSPPRAPGRPGISPARIAAVSR